GGGGGSPPRPPRPPQPRRPQPRLPLLPGDDDSTHHDYHDNAPHLAAARRHRPAAQRPARTRCLGAGEPAGGIFGDLSRPDDGASDPVIPTTVYAGTRDRVFKSLDGALPGWRRMGLACEATPRRL